MADKQTIERLKDQALEMRELVLKLSAKTVIHLGGDLSMADMMTALYMYKMKKNLDYDGKWPERDRFVLSKGHGAGCLYIAMAMAGYGSIDEIFETYGAWGSRYGMHPCKNQNPGMEVSSGSLGHGLTLCSGLALAAKERGDMHHVFTLLGDGECNEGAVWEGAMLAAHYKLGNLVALIDRNMVSLSSPTEEYYGGLKLEPLGKKFEAFLNKSCSIVRPIKGEISMRKKELALEVIRRLKEEYPDTWVHTHLCENKDEIAWVKSLYPDHDGYLDVYHQYGLTGKNCVFAHCVHLEEKEWDRLSETKSSIAFCPTSNLYLGSGLFNLKKAWQKKVKVGMGTDIGAGTTFNMLQTLNEAYKVLQLQGYRLSAYEAFYLATLGGAKSLGLDDLIGNFLPGKEADFVVMEPTATPLQQLRYDNSVSLVDKLFVMMTLGDDRSIYRTYVDGRLVYERN